MKHELVKIVVSGPESTGKTEVSRQLARRFNSHFVPEFARSYVERLKRPYTYQDVEYIARMQQEQLEDVLLLNHKLVILDTYLVITKIWFREVYGRIPDWIDRKLRDSGINLFLLCYYDIEWIEDPVRENPGQRRSYLFDQYRKEIELLGIPYHVVRGIGSKRLLNAENAILHHFPNLKNLLQ